MNTKRVVMVYAEPAVVGSGYLLGPSLAMTAKHVVAQRKAIEVWSRTTGQFHLVSVLWSSDDQLDACLLRLEEAIKVDLGPLVPAACCEGKEALDWECAGFPDAASFPRGQAVQRDSVGGFGVIAAGGGAATGMLDLTVAGWPRTAQGWQGLSGAAVIAQGYVVGMIHELPPDFQGRRLRAVPMKRIVDACRVDHPDWLAFRRAELPRVPTVGLSTRIHPPPAKYEQRPAAVLLPDRRAVPFQEILREKETGLLATWYGGDEPVAIRLIHGPGGAGKTRLMIEECARLRADGWHAGFLSDKGDVRDLMARIAQSGRRTLIVIDYAEARPDLRSLLTTMVEASMEHGGLGVRVVLLARNAGDWWTLLVRAAEEDLRCRLEATDPFAMSPVEVAQARRLQVFNHARTYLAQALGQTTVPDIGDVALEDEEFARVLYIHLAALASLRGESLEATKLLDEACDHEERFWRQAAQGLARWAEDDLVKHARFVLAAITLVGGASETQAERVLPTKVASTVPHLLSFLHDLWPGRAEAMGGDEYIAAVEPDLLGEAMVRRCLQHSGRAVFLAALDGATQDQMRHAYLVLGRLCESNRHDESLLKLAARCLSESLGTDAQGRAVAACEATLALVQSARDAEAGSFRPKMAETLLDTLESLGTPELAAAVHARLPEQSFALAEIAFWAAQCRLKGIAAGADREKADCLVALGNRQSAPGKREEAMASTSEAVDIYQRLAKDRPDAFLPYLAMSLNNLGNSQSALGKREEAMASTSEAVGIYKRLAQARPDAFLPDLAKSLNNLGLSQSELGKREEAVASTSEAVGIYKRLAQARPDAFLPDLASSLNNLGAMQSALGKREEAMASTSEAVGIYKRLAQARPDAFLPDLASSLNNLGAMQSALGKREGAMASTSEAVDIRRRLVKARPDAFLPDLASSLNNLGNSQSALGKREEAMASTSEAVDIRRRLAQARPDAFLPDLASSLNNLGFMQSELGKREEALASTSEAVDIYKRLAQARPDAFLPDLASSLNNLGNRQSELAKREEALASTSEAVDIYKRLAQARPDALLPDLAMSLNNLGNRQSELGKREEALASTSEAVDIYKRLAQARPDAFLPDLAMSLNNLGNRQSELGKREEALASISEAADIYKRLAQARPDAFLPDLAGSLNNLGASQSELGKREEALASTSEAVRIFLNLAQTTPAAFMGRLRIAAGNFESHMRAVAEPAEEHRRLLAELETLLGSLAGKSE